MYDYWHSNPRKGKKNNPLQKQNSLVIDLGFKPIPAMKMNFGSGSAPVIPLQKSKKQVKKKDLTYYQAKSGKYPNLSPYGDVDKDRIPNLFDCRPFDANRDFFGLGDIRKGASKLVSKFGRGEEQPQRFPQKTVQTKLPLHKKVYLYIKADGTWSKVAQFDKDSDVLKQSVEQLYKEGAIEEHIVTGSPNDERKLNFGEKVVKPVVREARRAKEHFVETAPKAVRAYQKRIGLGETAEKAKSVLGERVRRGLELKPYAPTTEELYKKAKKVTPRRVTITETLPKGEEVKAEYQIPAEKEPEIMRREPFVPRSFEEKAMMEEAEILPSAEEVQAPRRGMPPYSRGWYGSIGGSRPYRPVPYRPTGKIWKPERIHNPNPKIPVLKPFFVGKKRIEEEMIQ